jgi:hypothetical protein
MKVTRPPGRDPASFKYDSRRQSDKASRRQSDRTSRGPKQLATSIERPTAQGRKPNLDAHAALHASQCGAKRMGH